MQLLERDHRGTGVAADVVDGQQAQMPIHGGVLETLGHRGPGQLLKAHGQLGLELPLMPKQ